MNSIQDHFRARLIEALEVANIPSLLAVLVQLTGDIAWLGPEFEPSRPLGMDDNDDGGLPPKRQAEVRQAAAAAIMAWRGGAEPSVPDPSGELLRRILSVAMAEEIPEEYGPLLEHQFSVDQEPERLDPPPGFDVIVVGAGFSGLCAGYHLERAGIDFTILEKDDTVGGTWHDNVYPGAGVDTPSHLYSFSFAPHDWPRWFSLQPEVKEYLEEVADRFGLVDHIRFGTEVTEAEYDEAAQRWSVDVRTADGTHRMQCAALISAVGIFNPPLTPDIDGLDGFGGACVHSARWPPDLDLADRDVAIVGTGASAMQIVPAIADRANSVTVYQRSKQWVLPFPKLHQLVPEPLRWLFANVPLYAQWYRARLGWTFNDKLHPVLQIDPGWSHPERSINAANDRHRAFMTGYIESELGAHLDELRDKVIPDYPPYGKRMLLDNGWFRTLTRDDVELVTEPIQRVEVDGIVTSDGNRRTADVIVLATGFDVARFLTSFRIRGRDGIELQEQWGDDGRAYLGSVVPGYPNFFCLYGPNLQPGHGGSILFTFERQMHFILSLLGQLFDRGDRVAEVRLEVHDRYNAQTDARLARTVWTHPGMHTYYRNSAGRIVVNSPYRHSEWWRLTERADLTEFHTERALARADAAPASDPGAPPAIGDVGRGR